MSAWSSAMTLCSRELLRCFRQRNRILGLVGSPVLFWLLLGSGLGSSFRLPGTSTEMNYLEYFFPGMLLLVVLFTSIFSAISTIQDRREGFLQTVLVAPIPAAGIAGGKILGGTFLALVQAVILLALAPTLGIFPGTGACLATIAILFLISFGLSALGFCLAWRMDSIQGFHAVMNLLLFPMWLLSGALFPASGASGWMRVLMYGDPLTYGLAALRRSLYGEGSAKLSAHLPDTWLALALTSLFAALMFALAIHLAGRGRGGRQNVARAGQHST